MRKHILALGGDPSIQQTLWQAFGNEVEVMYNNGTQPIFNLVKDVPPDVILADIKLFRNSELGNQIKKDDRVAGVPLFLLANETEIIADDQLVRWGATGVINQPVDPEELKLRVGNFLDTYATGDELPEINIDEFRLDNLDEELRNLNRWQEPSPPPDRGEETFSGNDHYADELDQILAEIDEIPTIDPKKEGTNMKAEEKPEEMEEVAVSQEYNQAPQAPPKIEIEMPSPSPQSNPRPSVASGNGSIEQWFRGIAEEKIAEVIAHEDFGRIIEKVAQSVVPRIAEELVSKEIERIKQKIAGE
jgi:CheY-like chemotaxis protein